VDTATIHSGCVTDGDGNIACAPETMRAGAEKVLQQSEFWPRGKPLTLAMYTLARYMQSEAGDGSVEERAAVGEVAVNQARRRGQDINGLLLYAQPNHLYGSINVPGKGNINHRWATTSHDPSVLTVLLADLVTSGKSENVSRGADDQDGLEFYAYFPVPMNRVLSEARAGRYWVGPIPGIDHWKVTLFQTLGHAPTSAEGKSLIERARAVFGSPTYEGGRVAQKLRPVWPADLPVSAGVGPQPFLGIAGERVLWFGDSLSRPGEDAGPTVTDVDATSAPLLRSAPGAVAAGRMFGGSDGQRAAAVRVNARVGRSAQSFFGTEDAAALLRGDAAFRPTRVVVMLGTNDIDQGTDAEMLKQTKAALRRIRDAYRATGAQVVAVGPPSYPNKHYDRGAATMLAALQEVFGAERTLDARPLSAGAERTPDGIHFTQAGAQLVGERLARALTSA